MIALREVEDSDLDVFFDQMRDPDSVRMAAFTAKDPNDRAAFDAHTARNLSSPDVAMRTITEDGRVVGSIASYVMDGDTEVTYWIDRAVWGRGVASRAMELFLEVVTERPLRGRAVSDNVGSLRVLQKSGFRIIGTETAFAAGRNGDVEETILQLD